MGWKSIVARRKYLREYAKMDPVRWATWRRKTFQKTYLRRSQLLAELKNKPCMDCQGWFNPWQMEFDHREPENKTFTVAAQRTSTTLKVLLEEIKKCDVVCANCHLERAHKRKILAMAGVN